MVVCLVSCCHLLCCNNVDVCFSCLVLSLSLSLFQQLVRKVCVNRGMVDKEVKSSINAYVVYKELASVDKVSNAI